MAWAHTQRPEDVTDMLYATEKLVAHCLDASPDRDLFKYIGTAATARDLAALADALDGPGSPINLWAQHHGSVLASHLMQSECRLTSRSYDLLTKYMNRT